jgi:hypothetical protein
MATGSARRYDREVEPDRPWSLEAAVAETRSELRSVRSELRGEIRELRTEVRSDIAELRTEVRRLDDRFFQLLLLQVGTLLAALGSLVSALLS